MTISKNIRIAVLGAAFLAVALFAMPSAKAEAATVSELLAQIQALTAQLNELKAKMSGVAQERNELRVELKTMLREGMSDEDIKKIQEVLATDPSIYPQGLVTGYYGPLTKEALKRFQQRFELKVSGELDEDTIEYLEELLEERFGDKIPPGLLRAPGIMKKIELRMLQGDECSDKRGLAFLCQKLKIKYGDDDDDAYDDDDANDDEDELEIEVEFEDGDAKVKITYEDGSRENFTIKDTTDESEVIDAIVDRTDLTEDEVEDVIEFEEEQGDVEEITARIDEDENETEVTVEYENGDTDTFTYDETDENEIIALVADEIDMDEEDVEDLIEFEDGSDEVEYIKVDFTSGDSKVTIKYGNGVIDMFTLDNITRHNEVIDGIVDETDISEDDVRDIIDFLDGDLVIEVDVDMDNDESEVDITYENGDHESFTLDMTDEADIIEEIADRTDLTEEEIEEVIDFN